MGQADRTRGGGRLGCSDHGLDLDLSKPGRGMEVVVWTDDADAAFARLTAAGGRALSEPHDWLDGRLRVAWVADLDGNPIELVESRGSDLALTPDVATQDLTRRAPS